MLSNRSLISRSTGLSSSQRTSPPPPIAAPLVNVEPKRPLVRLCIEHGMHNRLQSPRSPRRVAELTGYEWSSRHGASASCPWSQRRPTPLAHSHALAAREVRRSFLGEGCDAFDEVGRCGLLLLDLRLEFELLLYPSVNTGVELALGASVGPGRTGGQSLYEPAHLDRELSVFDDVVDQPPHKRLIGSDPLAQHRHLHRAGTARTGRYKHRRAPVGDQPDVHEREQEVGAASGDNEVASEGE